MPRGDEATQPRSSGSTSGALPGRAVAAILLGVVVVAISRSPYVLLRGRLWAEEGSVFLRHMLDEPDASSLVFVPARTGYLNLFADGATWLASHGPLERAPLVTAWLSLAVLLAVVAVVLRWPSDLLTTAPARLVAAAVLVVGTTAVPEVWLTSVNTTTTFGILAVVLLFVRVDDLTRRQVAVGLVLLALAGLSGMYAAVLAPLFVLVALEARTPRRWAAAAVASGAAAVQLLLLVGARPSGALVDARLSELRPDEVARTIGGVHLGGVAVGVAPIDGLTRAIDDGSAVALAVLAALALVVVGVAAATCWRAPDRRVPLLLVSAFAIVELAVLVASLTQGAPPRYAVVPITIVTLLLIHGATTVPDRWLARAATALVAVALVAGLAAFWTVGSSTLRCTACPDWVDQVEAWQAGGPNEVEVWPYDGDERWTVGLPPSPVRPR